MTQRMLIDARHPEETRVAVLSGNRIEEFDFESAERKQLKGNIYLAKVTRVEPSLQAAFIEFGGNRHGFLAFSEIHPDYYQIPKEDREALLREEAEEAAALAEDEDDEAEARERGGAEPYDDGDDHGDDDHSADDRASDHGGDFGGDHGDDDPDHAPEHDDDGDADGAAPAAKAAGGGEGDQVEALRRRRQALRRRYKIQDVIHRRQVLLVQVVKEERGNKGAALTTYLSLAGRYCVLMPNTSSGGGISRKISNAADRKRLKTIMGEMRLPKTMGCIVRTAGLSRTKGEIKRDFDYLARLWDEIRDRTLGSSAPACIHEDSSLIKRAIRDIYTREIDEVLVEGERGYHAAREFMKLLMPVHARKIRPYSDVVPLFQRFGAEDQLSAMYHPVVQLKSGGYLVINPTEALVSIDINSGRSTREHNIEQTATATNLEAAHEIARQLRLRDMAGLVVIDFIDMDNSSNVRKVEKAMKEALRNDRARIQVGRISSFGLMEMSRQRLRTGVLEASTRICPHCEGSGFVRTASSAGLSALRLIEEAAARGRGSLLTLRASREAAIYVLNNKRDAIGEIEDRYGVHVDVLLDGHDEGARMTIDVSGPPPAYAPKAPAAILAELDDPDLVEDEDEDGDDETMLAPRGGGEDGGDRSEARDGARDERPERGAAGDDGERGGRKRRRRRRGGRRDEAGGAPDTAIDADGESEAEGEPELDAIASDAERDETSDAPAEAREGRGRRRRGRRGGRRGEPRGEADGGGETGVAGGLESGVTGGGAPFAEPPEPFVVDAGDVGPALTDGEDAEPDSAIAATAPAEPPRAEEAPRPRTRRRPRARADLPADLAAEPPVANPAAVGMADAPVAEPEAEPVAEAPAADAAPKPRRGRRKAADAIAPAAEAASKPAASAGRAPDDGAAAPADDGDEARAPRARRPRRRAADPASEAAAESVVETVPPAATPAPVPERAPPAPVAAEPAEADLERTEPAAATAGADAPEGADPESNEPPRRGWWQRTFGA